MGILSRGAAAGLFLLAASAAAAAADRAIIVLDASGSMWGQIEGRPKLEIARDALRTVLQSSPADMELGLMAYGHREKGSCTDIQLVVPPVAGSASAITQAADAMKFLGSTPLSASVRQAAEALKYTEEKSTVILITDGVETCEADPCALGKELEEAGADFTVHVVGFGLTADEGRQVACLAENTGGRFIEAKNAAALKDALARTVVATPAPEPEPAAEPAQAPEPEPAPPPPPAEEVNFAPTLALSEGTGNLGDAGQSWTIYKALPDGSRGERVRTEYGGWKGADLDPGSYVVVARLDRTESEQPVTVEAGRPSTPRFVLDAGTLVLRPLAAERELADRDAMVKIAYPGGSTTVYGEARIVVPAGEITVTARIGKGEVTETFSLRAGQTVEKDIVVGIGRAAARAFYVEGETVESRDLMLTVFKAGGSPDDPGERVDTGYGARSEFNLPPGDYVAVAKLQKAEGEAAFSVSSGERVEVDVLLDAGVLAVTAPGARQIRIYRQKNDLQDARERIETGYDANLQVILNAGEYVAVAHYDGDRPDAERTVRVNAGERSELTIE